MNTTFQRVSLKLNYGPLLRNKKTMVDLHHHHKIHQLWSLNIEQYIYQAILYISKLAGAPRRACYRKKGVKLLFLHLLWVAFVDKCMFAHRESGDMIWIWEHNDVLGCNLDFFFHSNFFHTLRNTFLHVSVQSKQKAW